jgi:putative nucleotidyltransferase with HDIG domain
MPNLNLLQQALGADASLIAVGGYVRDRLLGRSGGDLDLATALMPEVVTERARKSGLSVIPTGLGHGTVTVLLGGKNIEITTFRGDGKYLDGRRPSTVNLGVSLEEDLARRDFTINAMALPINCIDSELWRSNIIDPFGGQRDLEAKLIRAVGNPSLRFEEDGLRPFRACRFASQLGFAIESKTGQAIPQMAGIASKVAAERIYQELTKLLMGIDAPRGLTALADFGLLDISLPELAPAIGCEQNLHHAFDVWGHSLEVVKYSPADPAMRWAALFHDVGKPAAKFMDSMGQARFHGHEELSVKMASQALKRLKAPKVLVSEVLALIKHHGAKPDGTWSNAACRRLLHRLAKDGLDWRRWASLQFADQMGKGKNSENIQQAHAQLIERMEKIACNAPPLDVKALAIDGNAIIKIANKDGGPWVGALQKFLLEAVLDDPKLNSPQDLEALAKKWLDGQRS